MNKKHTMVVPTLFFKTPTLYNKDSCVFEL